MTLTPVQRIVELVGTFATSGSAGKLLVYDAVCPGRFVSAAHDVQKKNAVICRSFSGSGCEPFRIAKSLLPLAKISL